VPLVYVSGGKTSHLLEKMRNSRFTEALARFLHHGGLYVGVSAGSVAMAANLHGNLGYLPAKLLVHAAKGAANGPWQGAPGDEINLEDAQAILLSDAGIEIFA